MEKLTDRELEILRLISEGSSDREISQKLYLSINTVKWHNRQIYAKLGVGSRTEALAIAAEKSLLDKESPAPSPTIEIRKHNLPAQISSFIGREEEITKIKDLLNENRLVTLTGPGGVGKTRLALQVAAKLVEDEVYPDGIFLVELAVLTKSDRIGNVILDALGIPATPGVPVFEGLRSFL